MAKRRSDPALAAGERLLAAWGVDESANAAVLGELIGRAAAADAAIAARLGEIANTESAILLQRLERDSADRAIRKEAKRALYRLEQRGVAVAHGAIAAAKPILGAELEGYVSAVDGHGDQLLWILRTRADALLHFFAVLNDPEGLREVSLNAITRKSLREIRAELEQRHDLRLVEIDWRYADSLVHRAHAWARQRGARIEGDYLALRAQITHAPHAEAMENPLWQRIARDEVSAASWLQSSAEVLGEPELRTWFPDPAQLGPFLEELENIRNSPLVLNRTQQEERFEAVVGAAIEQVFGAAGSDSWQRRLEQMAYFFSASKRPERARQCAAAAEGLRRGLPFADIPLLATLLRGGLGAFFRRALEADAERQESSLIVTPQQLREQHKRR